MVLLDEEGEKRNCQTPRERKISRMKHMATRSIRKVWKTTSHWLVQGNGKRVVFKGSTKIFIENGAIPLQESVSLFNGKTNPIHYLSVDELNAMNLEPYTMLLNFTFKWYKGFWDGKWVLVREHVGMPRPELRSAAFREITVSAQMSAHKNVHKFLGCCIETKYPILVFEFVEMVTLHDRIVEAQPSLDWKQRLKIAWEISHALAYLHTGFQQPIVHRSIWPQNVFVGADDTAKLSDFSISISIPKGKEYVEDVVVGLFGYLTREYMTSARVAESLDVYAFGVLFLVLLTGKKSICRPNENTGKPAHLLDWIIQHIDNHSILDAIDPAIAADTLNNNEEAEQQQRASIALAIKCIATEYNTRPTMEEVAIELKSMIKASDRLFT